jgi:hypothetical protein
MTAMALFRAFGRVVLADISPRVRLLIALRGDESGVVPLTFQEPLLPRGLAERLLRNRGVGMVVRHPLHRLHYRTCEVHSREYWEEGRALVRRSIETPVGEIWQTLLPEAGYGNSNWVREHYIKSPGDYAVMEYALRDAVYLDNFEEIRESERRLGGDGIVMARMMKIPIQEMLYQMMGMERFAMDYRFERERFDSLHATLLERCRELFTLAARAPVEIIQSADNITADVVGGARFQRYFMPIYQEIRSCFAGSDKRLAVHMDGKLSGLQDLIGECAVDIIEGLTPPPVGNVSIESARRIWSDKVLWLNFTSSMHTRPAEDIAAHTRRLLEEAGSRRGLAISITDDAPIIALEQSLDVIQGVLTEMS